ncbi:hypothetical protein [Falsiroseomonas sp.]|uniref:hypothetical protein n=1 Tax=Falsiroseomonas sp. TaxID=2870721 RepID=UPI002733BC9C|nr:hypothetical protein [Falsiroseomonas sp.]
MIRALLEGRKTQTRRVIKPQPKLFDVAPGVPCEVALEPCDDEPWPRIALGRVIKRQEVRYRTGMRLWVRENWWTSCIHDGDAPRDLPRDAPIWFVTDDGARAWGTQRPSIHMPRWASRMTLTVTDVRVQRLHAISRGDAMEEGCPFPNMASGPNPRDWFGDLWNSIHGADAWKANPFVVAVTFTVERRNVDAQ